MKSSTALILAFGLMFALVAVSAVLMVNQFMRNEAIDEAESKARILLDQNLAIHSFYSEILKPSLFAYTAPFNSPDYFDPSWMSSTYANREIRQYFKSLNPAGYYVKDAAVNARSPENEADEVEKAFLAELRADPKLIERYYRSTVQGVPTMVYMRRGEVLQEACMGCHSEPERAPGALVRQYGPVRSFHREADVGKVISVISIRIPLSSAFAQVQRVSLQLSILLLAVLAALFMIQSWIGRRLLLRPLAVIRDKALEISGDERRLGEQIPLPFGLELAELARAFNTMSEALRRDRDLLEERIRDRTAELAASNELLAEDIRKRTRAEGLLQKALQENKGLLSELQHRAKNSFSMIDSLISLAAAREGSEETQSALGELANRVRSVSELYSLLYASGSVSQLRLDEYLSRVLSTLMGLSKSVQVATELEEIVVSAKVAAPLGLIVTELVTNALKHAFIGRQGGRILMSLALRGDRVWLSVRDDGRGLSEGTADGSGGRQGLGLVKELAAQIEGSFSLVSDGKGTLCAVDFPLPEGGASGSASDLEASAIS